LRLCIGHSILDQREPELVILHTSLQWYYTILFCSSVILECFILELRWDIMHDMKYMFLKGAFAFEDAMTRGAPLEEEVELLKQAAGGNDELIDIALQSLPEDALTKGTKTQVQLEREASLLLLNGFELVLYDLVFRDLPTERKTIQCYQKLHGVIIIEQIMLFNCGR
jgi:hypothetical protein